VAREVTDAAARSEVDNDHTTFATDRENGARVPRPGRDERIAPPAAIAIRELNALDGTLRAYEFNKARIDVLDPRSLVRREVPAQVGARKLEEQTVPEVERFECVRLRGSAIGA
jgi:hypothetical protein